MAIADTITSMQTHTSNAYTMIGYGTDLTGTNKNLQNLSTSIFNAFLEALRTPDTLFTNLPKKSGSGANITLNDTANAPMRITLGASELTQAGTPTPSSPQDIHCISGSNKVVVSDGNGNSQEADIDLGYENILEIANVKRTINGITFTPVNDGGILINGTATSNATYPLNYNSTNVSYSTNTYIQANTTYIISKTFNKPTSNDILFQIYFSKDGTTTYSTSTFTAGTTNTTLGAYIRVSSGDTVDNLIIYPQIEKGSVAHKYTPYGKAIEYCKIGNYEDKFIRTSGKNKLDYTTIANWPQWESYTYGKKLNLTLKPNTQYTLSSNVPQGTENLIYFNGTSTATNGVYANNPKTMTTDSNGNIYVGIFTNRDYYSDIVSGKYYIMLNEGTTALPYEPYGSNKWYKKDNINKHIMTSDDSFSNSSTRTNTFRFTYSIVDKLPNNTNASMIYCNRGNGAPDYYWSRDEVGICEVKNANQPYIIFSLPINEVNSYATAKTWFTNNETIIYYVLATPTYTKITGTLANQLENVYQKLLSYSGQTNISQVNNDLAFQLGVQAIEK